MRTCDEEGCSKPHRARGLCSAHWKERYGKPHRYLIICVVCGVEHMSGRRDGKYCSDTCKGLDYQGRPGPAATTGQTWTRRQRALIALHWAAKGQRGRAWAVGSCARCGDTFTTPAKGERTARFCSPSCLARHKRARRRAAERGVEREWYSRHYVFMRDGWRCHICQRSVDRTKTAPHPDAPTIDHLVPLAHGGPDTAANVATAHFACNSARRDKGGGEQLALIG